MSSRSGFSCCLNVSDDLEGRKGVLFGGSKAFFARWWHQQDEKTKGMVRGLVKDGRLEFSNGGWCMHDEAAPHYVDMIDQTTLGHKFLMTEFGVAPSTGWQLDPFGHSATQAALLSAEVGFQGLFFGRIDYQDLWLRRQNRAVEFVWRPSPSLGPEAQVFSGLTGGATCMAHGL